MNQVLIFLCEPLCTSVYLCGEALCFGLLVIGRLVLNSF